MIKLKKGLIVLIYLSMLATIFSINPGYACACGMLLSEGGKEIQMGGEQGVVIFDKEQQKEQMAIYFEMSGTSKNSALVVPTPTQAEIGQIKKEVISDIEYLINPPLKTDSSYGFLDNMPKGEVEVLERKIVGNFEIAVLKTNSYDSLEEWTTENNFKLAPQAKEATTKYIEKDYIINTIKLKKDADDSEINPLLFEFSTDRVFYPIMEFEGVETLNDKSLSLYILSTEKVNIPNLSLKNERFTKKEIESAISKTDDKDFENLKFAADSYYISKYETLDYSNDVEIKEAVSEPVTMILGVQNENEKVEPKKGYLWLIVLVTSLSLLVALAALVIIKYKKKWNT